MKAINQERVIDTLSALAEAKRLLASLEVDEILIEPGVLKNMNNLRDEINNTLATLNKVA